MEGSDPERQPIIQPRMVRLLKNRPKLFEFEARQRFLENLEKGIVERRSPEIVSERAGRSIAHSGEQALEPVLRDTIRERFSKANENTLKRL